MPKVSVGKDGLAADARADAERNRREEEQRRREEEQRRREEAERVSASAVKADPHGLVRGLPFAINLDQKLLPKLPPPPEAAPPPRPIGSTLSAS